MKSNLIIFFKQIFYPNWIVVETFQGTRYEHKNGFGICSYFYNIFSIEYSEVRNEYRLIANGHSLTDDPIYSTASKKVASLNKEIVDARRTIKELSDEIYKLTQ